MESIDYKQVSFDSICEVNDYFFASCGMFNGLLQIDKKTYEAEYICPFPGEPRYAGALHHKMYKYDNTLVFAPNNARGVHIYNLDEKRMEYYLIDVERHVRNRCIDSFLINDKMWLFYAFAEHPVVIFDLKTHNVDFFYGIIEALPQSILEREKKIVFWSTLIQADNKVYGVIWESPYVIEIDMVLGGVDIHELDKGMLLSAISRDVENVWVVEAQTKKLFKWNIKNRVKQEYSVKEPYLKSRGFFCNLIWCRNKLLVLFDDVEKVFVVNEDQGCIEELCSFPEGFRKMDDMRKKMRRFFSAEISENRVRFFPINANMMLELDAESELIRGNSIRMASVYDEDWYMKHFMCLYLKEIYSDKLAKEGKDFSLNTYLKYIQSI